MNAPAKVILVGCGKMGGALLKRAVSVYQIMPDAPLIYVVDPKPPSFQTSTSIAWVYSADEIDISFIPDLVIFAVKPQQIAATIPAYIRYAPTCVYLSIAAGVTLNDIEQLLSFKGSQPAIVRSMPNLPASIGQGVTALVANNQTTSAQQKVCSNFMDLAGTTVWLDDENLMNAVTALSGSGPAYIFALCEAMAKAGENLGLSPTTSLALARQTIIGSAGLLAASTETPEALRHAVTSPGGTTEAALKILLSSEALFELMQNAIDAATNRGKELSVMGDGKK